MNDSVEDSMEELMHSEKAAAASKVYRRAVNRLSEIADISPEHTRVPSEDFARIADDLESRYDSMTLLAIEKAREQGKPFRNPFVDKGRRLYRVTYRPSIRGH
ncbi:MAG TPA: hypothetical protein VF207_00685 [Chthoniobacterales bacterium]